MAKKKTKTKTEYTSTPLSSEHYRAIDKFKKDLGSKDLKGVYGVTVFDGQIGIVAIGSLNMMEQSGAVVLLDILRKQLLRAVEERASGTSQKEVNPMDYIN